MHFIKTSYKFLVLCHFILLYCSFFLQCTRSTSLYSIWCRKKLKTFAHGVLHILILSKTILCILITHCVMFVLISFFCSFSSRRKVLKALKYAFYSKFPLFWTSSIANQSSFMERESLKTTVFIKNDSLLHVD